jgi:hypothetical protein
VHQILKGKQMNKVAVMDCKSDANGKRSVVVDFVPIEKLDTDCQQIPNSKHFGTPEYFKQHVNK